MIKVVHGQYGAEVEFNFAAFPSGEPFVQLDAPVPKENITVMVQGFSSEEFLQLLSVLDILREQEISLLLPFFPGARQDRRENTPLSAKVFADAINRYGVKRITIVDPHSDVTPALLDNCRVVDLKDVIRRHSTTTIWNKFSQADGIIAPDAGASKKVEKLAKEFSTHKPVYQCSKIRDPKTGWLTGFTAPRAEGEKFIVVDDICDGGGTFLGLADAWQEQNPGSELSLYTTHGIYSKGMSDLFEKYRRIFTTNSFDQTHNQAEFKEDYFSVIDLFGGKLND